MAKYTTCSNNSRMHIYTNVKILVEIIEKYRWIIDAYVSDFYTLKYWEQLPKSMQQYFDIAEPSDLAWMLAADGKETQPPLRRVVPLSLMALHCCTQNMSLKRTAADINSPSTKSQIISSMERTSYSKRSQHGPSDATPNSQHPQKPDDPAVLTNATKFPNYKNGQCMDMKHIFRKHVKPKKQHEIDKLGQVINLLSAICECSNVVDVGAGLGHLSRLLTFQHGLKVTTVEAAGDHAPKATVFDNEVKKDLDKAFLKRNIGKVNGNSFSESTGANSSHDSQLLLHCDSVKVDPQNSAKKTCRADSVVDVNQVSRGLFGEDSTPCEKNLLASDNPQATASSSVLAVDGEDYQTIDEQSLPSHVICRVQPDIAAGQFLDIVKRRRQSEKETSDCTSRNNFILTSLHACGDLTPTLLRVFTDCPEAVGLASVACCYMKICQCSQNQTGLDNYPMSEFVKGLPNHHLSYEAREMACHFAEAYYCRLRGKDTSSHLKVHCYRAALQYLVTTVNPQFKSGQVRLISKKGVQGTFSQYASVNLKKLNIDFDNVPKDLLEYCEDLTKHWKRVVAFYTLRLSLAPAVESLILLDRALFLLEKGVSSILVPIFDSSISPRNFALMAVKS